MIERGKDQFPLQGVERPSGLFVPIVQRPSSVLDSLEGNMPKLLRIAEASKNNDLLPNQKNELVLPSDKELLTYGTPKEKILKVRSSTEIARAVYKPHIFLAEEVEKQLTTNFSPEVNEVLDNLKRQGEDRKISPLASADQLVRYSENALQRQQVIQTYKNYKTGEKETVLKSKPGAVEQVGLAAVASLKDPEIKCMASNVVLKPFAKLLREYRTAACFKPESKRGETLRTEPFAPELPNLATELTTEIDHFPAEREARFGIYNILEQTTIPSSLQEILIEKLDQHGDLDHPFAFQLTRAIAARDPDFEWIKTQQERREELLISLDATDQELFDNFDNLLKQSRGLVYSDDPVNPREGKVGIEIEFQENSVARQLTQYYDFLDDSDFDPALLDYILPKTGIGNEWIADVDGENNELKRSDGSLLHDSAYVDSLNDLRLWFGDYANELRSIHLHFDRNEHPYKPHLGNLFAENVSGKEAIYPNTHYHTWEVRSLNLPRSGGNIHPGRVDDLINLYISAAEEDPVTSPKKLSLDYSSNLTVKKMTWGHIVTHLEDREGLLAALLALQDDMALKSVTPLSFANSVRKEDVPIVAKKLEGQFDSDIDKKMLKLLKAYGEGNGRFKEIFLNELDFNEENIVYKSLGEANTKMFLLIGGTHLEKNFRF